MVKDTDGIWEVELDFGNPYIDFEIGENKKYQEFEKIVDIKKWVNDLF